MSIDRRSFLQKIGTLSGAITVQSFLPESVVTPLETARERVLNMSDDEVAKDEDFWQQIRQAYTVSANIMNMNNGGLSPQPRVVQEARERYNNWANEVPSLFMWRTMKLGKEPLRNNLALLAGCSAEEIAIDRNACEALETVIFGLRLDKGDEVVLSRQDYPNMMNAWKQREKRDGIVLKWVDFDVPDMEDKKIVEQYNNALTNKTKVVHITHIISWTGQILPVREIANIAKAKNIEVLVDGAQSFAHLVFNIPDLNCDYYGTSLHKWLCAPFGTGMLYVRKSKIKTLYPLFAAPDPEEDDIRKFEHLGTRSFAIEQAIGQAIIFHEYIGGERKLARLNYLRKYWVEQIKNLPKVQIITPQQEGRSAALCLFSVKGSTPQELGDFLHKDPYRIHTTVVNQEQYKGVRISPNVYTLTRDLDRLVSAISAFVETK
ncbi:MAG: aminotransferase class V-fold PLP-dependent enzyme [Saprospiraceae bacterium]